MADKGNIYFASDFHLGLKTGTPPLEREKKVVRWLNMVAPDAREIYLLGDVFDFWWEYKLVVPRGFTRFLGTVAEITDSGIPVHFFTGNHDMWTDNYLSDECGMIVHTAPVSVTLDGKHFHLAHGEGLGTRNTGYRILLAIFRNKPLRAMYSALHPAIGLGIGHQWSLSSRLVKGERVDFKGEAREDLIRYASDLAGKEKYDYFIFGHRHIEMIYPLTSETSIVFLGDWIQHGSFAVWDGNELDLKSFD